MELKEENIALAEVLINYIKEHTHEEEIKVTYEEISNRLWKEKHIKIEPFRLGNNLGSVSSYFYEKGFPFISGIVVNKTEPHIPGSGFFYMLRDYGIVDVLSQYKEIKKAQTYKDYQKLYNSLYNK